MRWRLAFTLVGTVLLVAAGSVMSLQVRVGGSGLAGRTCGSPLDVVIDRTDWKSWFQQDGVDPAPPPADPLLRTLRCPAAINARTVVAAGLGAGAAVSLLAAWELQRRGRSVPVTMHGLPTRLLRLGRTVTVVGVTLVIAGVGALAILLADREAMIFNFVGRPVAALIGLVVLTPVLALVVHGRALSLLAHGLSDGTADDGTT